MLSVQQAFDRCVAAMGELKLAGIRPSMQRRGVGVWIPDGPHALSVDQWFVVTYVVLTAEQSEVVEQVEERLRQQGITFDVSAVGEFRDWALDWSFEVAPVAEKAGVA